MTIEIDAPNSPKPPADPGPGTSVWPKYSEPPSVAFFDVDGTLLPKTTSYLFVRLLLEKRLIRPTILLQSLYRGMQHHFGRLDYARLVDYAARKIGHLSIDVLESNAQEAFDREVQPRLYQGAVDHAAELREMGTPVVLISSSPRLVLEPLARHLGCADVLSTPFVIENGRFAGIGDGPPCYGPGKVHWAKTWCDAHRHPLERAAAYADNWSDRLLLECVGQANVVHPRRKLRRLARERGWNVIRPRS